MSKPFFKDVLITGGTGFIGRKLCVSLQGIVAPNNEIFAVGSRMVDLTNREATFSYFENLAKTSNISHIFHLASVYKAGDWHLHHPATCFQSNLSITANLFGARHQFLPHAKLISILPYCVYPNHPAPHPESELWGYDPNDYLYAYFQSKKAILAGQRAYREQFQLQGHSVILPTVFGEGDSFAENSHVIGALIGKFVRATLLSKPSVEVWGDGSQEREFIHVDDAVEGLLRASQVESGNLTDGGLNIGTGYPTRVQEIVEIIKRETGYLGEVRFATQQFTGVNRRTLDVTRMKSLLHWSPATDLVAGIVATIAWYRAQLISTKSDETLESKIIAA